MAIDNKVFPKCFFHPMPYCKLLAKIQTMSLLIIIFFFNVSIPLSGHQILKKKNFTNFAVDGVIPPYYVFPSGLVYKGPCLVAEYMELLPFH